MVCCVCVCDEKHWLRISICKKKCSKKILRNQQIRNIQTMNALNIPSISFNRLVRHTRLDDKVLPVSTRNCAVKGAWFALGHELAKSGDNFAWQTWTVENGKHVVNFNVEMTPDGKLVHGVVNVFAFGFMACDQDYLNEFLNEIKQSGGIQWDIIE